MSQQPSPAAVACERIVGVDLARGIALLAMASTHIMATTDSATGLLTGVGWAFAGRAAALFALLAGVSLALVTGGTTPPARLRRARTTIAVRALLIGCIGIVLTMTDTPVAVILAYYAVYFLLALPFLRLRARTLVLLAVGWALIAPQLSFWLRGSLPERPDYQVDLAMVVTEPLTAAHTLLVTGYYPAITWLTYLLAGLAIGRSDLRQRATAVWLIVVGAVLSVGSWIASSLLLTALGVTASQPTTTGVDAELVGRMVNHVEWYGATPADDWHWLVVAGPHSGTTFDLLTTTGSAMAVLGISLLLMRSGVLRLVLHPLVAVGTMTLTLYTVHVIATALPSYSFDDLGYYLTHAVVALVAATMWLRFFRRGPIEQVVHTAATETAEALEPRKAPTPG